MRPAAKQRSPEFTITRAGYQACEVLATRLSGLMSRAGDALAASGEGFEDLVGGLGPRERLRCLVPLVDPLADAGLEVGALRWAEWRSLRLASSANQRSTRFIQLELVGMKCRWKRGCFSSHWRIAGVLRVSNTFML